ncbi:MAG TPA: hypothetical protein VIL86_16860 [Tepidisphaeraceae bacterium]|jgi:hypothetical protein
MRLLRLNVAVLMALWCGIASGRDNARDNGREKDPPAETTSQVVRFVSAHKGSFMGKDALLLTVAPPAGGKTFEIAVPNDPPMGGYNPSPAAARVVKDLKSNDLIQVRTEKMGAIPSLTQIDPYRLKPGEDTPRGFLFIESKEEKVGGQDVTVVVLEKFGQQATVVVSAKKGADGKMAPDSALMDAINGLKRDDVVNAEVKTGGRNATLISIEPYVEPLHGEFVKSTQTEVDGKKMPAIEIKGTDKTDTILVPGVDKQGKWITDAKILDLVKHFKTGQTVDYRVKEEGEKLWLKEISPSAPHAEITEKK